MRGNEPPGEIAGNKKKRPHEPLLQKIPPKGGPIKGKKSSREAWTGRGSISESPRNGTPGRTGKKKNQKLPRSHLRKRGYLGNLDYPKKREETRGGERRGGYLKRISQKSGTLTGGLEKWGQN